MAPNQPRPTKAQRREKARAQAKALREQQLRRDRRAAITRRSVIAAAGAAVVGAVGYVVYDYLQDRDDTPEASATTTGFPALGTVATARADRKGVPGPVLSDGAWTYGPKGALDTVAAQAPVLDVFFDYSCHFCASFETTHASEISTLLADSRITLVLHPTKALQQDWTNQVMNALGVVLDKAPDQSLAFHTAAMELFGRIYDAQDVSMMTTENLVAAASQAGVPESVSAEFARAVDGDTYKAWVTLGQEAMTAADVTATPTVFLDGKELDLTTLRSQSALTDLVSGAGAATEGSPGQDSQDADSTEQPEGEPGQ